MADSLYQKTKNIVEKYGFSFKKNFGQNFLIDERVLEKTISSANLTKYDTVIEVGPGIGTLTAKLAEKAAFVKAYEIDKTLIPLLSDTLSEYDNIKIINEDILKADIKEEIKDCENVKVVANLPYYITAPVIMRFLEESIPAESITVMVQKEVAARMQAKPNSKDYGAFSVAINYYCEPYLVANVPQNCFIPRPKIDSAVIRLTPYKKKPIEAKNKEKFFSLVKAAFSQRRKTLANCIYSSEFFSYDSKTEAIEDIISVGFDPKIRGEALSIEDFVLLSDNINRYCR